VKLNLVPARQGVAWVKQGVHNFRRQPLALMGLFFMFMAAISVVTLVPVLGSALALGLLPAATLGLMAAAREAELGRFPMPSVLASAFRAGRERLNAMLVLGGLYALGFLLIMGLSALMDGGTFAKLYLVGGKMTAEMVESPDFQSAMWLSTLLYLPFSLAFWHAPGLVHWHGISPVKSLFFSLVACWRNKGAMLVYGLTWVAVFALVGTVVTTLAALLGGADLVGTLILPTAMVMAAMFFASVYASFRDSFLFDDEPGPAAP